MRILLLGSTGLLGQAFAAESERRDHLVRDAARQDAAISLDISDDARLLSTLEAERPDCVINCAALTNIAKCDEETSLAYRINARPVSLLSEWSRRHEKPFLQISTDHFFVGEGATAHDEGAPVTLVNEYARSKYCGEALALIAPKALVLRTSIVGFRGWSQPTFAEWAVSAILSDEPITMFSDAYTSSIDVQSFARGAMDLMEGGAAGLLNLACREVYSKEAFICELAAQLGHKLINARPGSITSLAVRRADSLGLNVDKAEHLLGYPLPTLKGVVASVLAQRQVHSQR